MRATVPANFGSSRSSSGADVAVLVGVPAHGHDAGVVGVVGAVGVLGGVRDLVPGLHLVRGEVVGGGGGDGLADIEDVGGGVGALVGLGGVELFLDEAFGLSSVTLISGYFFLKLSMTSP